LINKIQEGRSRFKGGRVTTTTNPRGFSPRTRPVVLDWKTRPAKILSHNANDGSPSDDFATLVEDKDCMLDNQSEMRSNSDECEQTPCE